MKVVCKLNNKEIDDDRHECILCDYYNRFTVCTYPQNKGNKCPLDNRYCNKSYMSSIYDCRNDYGFETRPCKGYGGIGYSTVLLPMKCPNCGIDIRMIK